MNKRFVNAAIVYAVLAMVFSVFYREYTKILDFSGATTLSVVHTHYFAMGMSMFLLFALLDKAYGFAGQKRAGGWVVAYHVGLNLTVLGLVARRGLRMCRARSFPARWMLPSPGSAAWVIPCWGSAWWRSCCWFVKKRQTAENDMRNIPTVPKRYLLLLAGLIWLAAGTNILLIGVSNFAQGWDGNFLYGLLAIAVFTVFVLIFFPMVRKHHTRC